MDRSEIKKKFERLYLSYLKNLPKEKVFFDNSLEGEILYLKHHRLRYLNNLYFFAQRIGNKKKPKVLDIGGSPFTFFLKEIFPQIELILMDLSTTMSARCAARKIKFVNWNIAKLPLPFQKNQFDFIFFTEVLEHVFADHGKILNSIGEILNKDGCLFLQTPNGVSLDKRIRFLFGKNIVASTEILINPLAGIDHHIVEYSLPDLLSLVKRRTKLKVESKEYGLYYDNLPTALVYRKNKTISFLLVLLYCFLTLFVPSLRRGIQIVFKKE